MNEMLPQRAIIDSLAYSKLAAHCSEALPLEACGVLTGHSGIDSQSAKSSPYGISVLHVTDVHPVANAAAYPEKQFRFDPQDWVKVLYRIQKNRQTLVGFFHSHPASPPMPSPADRDGLPFDFRGFSYWIVSPATGTGEMMVKPYWLHERRFIPLMLAQVSV